MAKGRKCAACGTLLFQHLGPSGHRRCRHPELLADLTSQVQFSNTAHQPCTPAMSSSTLSLNPNPPQGNPPPHSSQHDKGSLSDVSSAHTRSQTPVSSQESASNDSTLSSASGGSHTTQVSATLSYSEHFPTERTQGQYSSAGYHGFSDNYVHPVTARRFDVTYYNPAVSSAVLTSVSTIVNSSSGYSTSYSGTNNNVVYSVNAPRVVHHAPTWTYPSFSSYGNGLGYPSGVHSSVHGGLHNNSYNSGSQDTVLMHTLFQCIEDLTLAVRNLQQGPNQAPIGTTPVLPHSAPMMPPGCPPTMQMPPNCPSGTQPSEHMMIPPSMNVQQPHVTGPHSNSMGATVVPPSGQNIIGSVNYAGNHPNFQCPLVEMPGTRAKNLSCMEPHPGLLRSESWGNLPAKTLKTALRGECLNLEDIIDCNSVTTEPVQVETFMDSDFNITHKSTSKKARKTVDNIVVWLEAWSIYEQIMVSHYGMDIYREMAEYKKYIIEQDKKYFFHAVYAYDVKHRSALGGKSLYFNTLSPTLYHQCFEARSAKVTNETGNKQVMMQVEQETPFQQPPATEQKAKRVKSKSICFKFNDLLCTDMACTRRHICRGCRGEKPYLTCIKTGKCAARYTSEPTILGGMGQSSTKSAQSK